MNEPTFIDAESFQGGSDDEITFRMIVLEHLRRIGKIASREFIGGYWNDKETNIGGSMHIYVPDSREEYSNAVDYLYDILFPHFDDQIKKEVEEYKEWSDNKFDELIVKYTTEDKETGERVYTQREGPVWIDKERYKTAKVKVVKRKLFRIINSFLQRNNYLESVRFEE
jgi:hypothetical protein